MDGVMICYVICQNDEGMDEKKHDPINVPMGPVTRARAKQFKEHLNGLIQKIQQEGSSLHIGGDQKLVNIIKVAPTHNQLMQHEEICTIEEFPDCTINGDCIIKEDRIFHGESNQFRFDN